MERFAAVRNSAWVNVARGTRGEEKEMKRSGTFCTVLESVREEEEEGFTVEEVVSGGDFSRRFPQADLIKPRVEKMRLC